MRKLLEWSLSIGIVLGAILGSLGWYLYLHLSPVTVQTAELETRAFWQTYGAPFAAPGIYFGALWGGFFGWVVKRSRKTTPGR